MTYVETTVQVANLAAAFRTDTGLTLTAATTFTDASASAGDIGKAVVGNANVPAGTYVTAFSGSTVTVSNTLSAGTSQSVTFAPRIRAVVSRTGFVRVYDPSLVNAISGSAAWTAAVSAAPSSLLSTNLPSLYALVTNSVAGDVSGPADYNDAAPWYSDPSAGTPIYGTYRLHLQPVVGSPDASSVQVVTVDAQALVILGSS
jgi:hypothetical protein